MKTYSVARTKIVSEYIEIEAKSEKEAIEKAKGFPEENWETNTNDEILDYDYNAEEI